MATNAQPQDYSCPRCGQVDRVDKVSALVSSGTAFGTKTYTQDPAIVQTSLASKLSPPIEPIYQSPEWGCGAISSIVLAILGSAFLVFAWVSTINLHASAPADANYTPAIITLIVVIALIGASIYFIVHHAQESKAREEATAIARRRWKVARDNWDKLYYCARNDVVFLPGKPNQCVPVSEIEQLLYKPI